MLQTIHPSLSPLRRAASRLTRSGPNCYLVQIYTRSRPAEREWETEGWVPRLALLLLQTLNKIGCVLILRVQQIDVESR